MVGLDPQHARIVKDALQEQARAGAAILLSTHQLPVAEELADRVGIMRQGSLIAMGTPRELASQSGESRPLEETFLSLTQTGKAAPPLPD
jgi:ABC-2 type transport system ATP-binding protein